MTRVATRHVVVDPAAPESAAVAEAAAVLRRGGIVAFPTETFYGLGALALDVETVRRIFEIKGRPAGKPLLVLVDSVAMVETIVTEVPTAAQALIARHWPGPLTLVLRARPELPPGVTAGSGTIGVRVSSHPVAQALVRAARAPVTAPSANLAGGPPPTTADAVRAAFEGLIDLVLDAGATAGGAPSTVVDATADPPRVLRVGAVTVGS